MNISRIYWLLFSHSKRINAMMGQVRVKSWIRKMECHCFIEITFWSTNKCIHISAQPTGRCRISEFSLNASKGYAPSALYASMTHRESYWASLVSGLWAVIGCCLHTHGPKNAAQKHSKHSKLRRNPRLLMLTLPHSSSESLVIMRLTI